MIFHLGGFWDRKKRTQNVLKLTPDPETESRSAKKKKFDEEAVFAVASRSVKNRSHICVHQTVDLLEAMFGGWWWFQMLFHFHPDLWGRWNHFEEHIFQMGWFNHQLGTHVWCFISKLLRDQSLNCFRSKLKKNTISQFCLVVVGSRPASILRNTCLDPSRYKLPNTSWKGNLFFPQPYSIQRLRLVFGYQKLLFLHESRRQQVVVSDQFFSAQLVLSPVQVAGVRHQVLLNRFLLYLSAQVAISSHLEETRGRDASECAPQSSCTALKRIMLRFSLPLGRVGQIWLPSLKSRRILWRLVVLGIHHLTCLWV